ncbi:MAG TPA: UDP-glucose/GDP-mannose dehydrogenase family protein [Gemmatimonadaceae bacterium]|nr:UDP-glucose/GDP-mannose dehydrogenase family protein [Gemmatimonadaceae bacterium]
MRIGVIGTGYVGLVVGACMAETGNDVLCADVDRAKIARLNLGDVPIYEPGLEPLVQRNIADGRLRFTSDPGAAVRASDVIFVAVPTPEGEDGSADLQHVLAVAELIGRNMDGEKLIVTKSTVPVGTAARIRETIRRHTSHVAHVCSNPEFLKEGAAVDDCMKPDRIVIGADSDHARTVLAELYAPFVRTGKPILFMDPASAEITKYAANAMLATRISFMNTIARLCEQAGADVELVRKGVGSDGRIGPSFLFPGCGYGGSCFPKDVKALTRTLRDHGVDASILESVDGVNVEQKRWALEALEARLGVDLALETIAVWGLSFKPDTDDMREAPSLELVTGLLRRGANVRVHDPQALAVARRYFEDRVEYCEQNYDALEGAGALVVLTEWQPYRRPDFDRMRAMMARPLIIDGRNLFTPARMREAGFDYVSIGRAPVTAAAAGDRAIRTLARAG